MEVTLKGIRCRGSFRKLHEKRKEMGTEVGVHALPSSVVKSGYTVRDSILEV